MIGLISAHSAWNLVYCVNRKIPVLEYMIEI